jgi:hypothetical protein
MNEQQYLSPDKQLRLLVTVPDGDITIGFGGCPAHTHGSILAQFYGCDEDAAAWRFITGILEGKLIIAIRRISGVMTDAWIPETDRQTLDDILADLERYGEQGETVEFRLWDGAKVEPSSIG